MDLCTDSTNTEVSMSVEPPCAGADRSVKEKVSAGRQFPGTEGAEDGVAQGHRNAVHSSAQSCSSFGCCIPTV